jgi:phage-related protein
MKAAWNVAMLEIGTAVAPVIEEIMPHIVTAIQKLPEVIDHVVEVAGPAFESIKNIISGVVDFLTPIIQAFGQSIDDSGTGKFAYFKTWLDENMPRIQQIVETVLGAIKRFWDEHGEAVSTIVGNMIEGVWTVIDTTMRTIMDTVQFWLQVFTGDWEGAGETLKGIVERWWGAIQTLFGLHIENIKTLFQDVNWGELGRAIVLGIANGIFNAHNIVIESAKNAAWAAFEGARNKLQGHSPSKLTEEKIGKPFAQGIASGINKEIFAMKRGVQMGMGNLVTDTRALLFPLEYRGSYAGDAWVRSFTRDMSYTSDGLDDTMKRFIDTVHELGSVMGKLVNSLEVIMTKFVDALNKTNDSIKPPPPPPILPPPPPKLEPIKRPGILPPPPLKDITGPPTTDWLKPSIGAPGANEGLSRGNISININMSGGGSYSDGRAMARGLQDELRARGMS